MLRPLEIKQVAKERLRGKWFDAAMFYLLVLLIVFAAELVGGVIAGPLVSIFFVSPLAFGYVNYTYKIWKLEKADFNDLWIGFRENYLKVVGLRFVVSILVGLSVIVAALVIGGIWYWISKSFTFALIFGFLMAGAVAVYIYIRLIFVEFILLDNWNNKEIGIGDIIEFSSFLTQGFEWKIFKFMLSFIGWLGLIIITIGIAALWFYPFYLVSLWELYTIIKNAKDIDFKRWQYAEDVVVVD